jgi:hypothetical protein
MPCAVSASGVCETDPLGRTFRTGTHHAAPGPEAEVTANKELASAIGDRAPAGIRNASRQASEVFLPLLFVFLLSACGFGSRLRIKEFLIIMATKEGSRLSLSARLHDRDNLEVLGLATRDIRPGFRYIIATIPREGIRSVNKNNLMKD